MNAMMPDDMREHEELDIADLLIVAWNNWYWFLLIPLLSIATALLFLFQAPVRYSATASVVLPTKVDGRGALNLFNGDKLQKNALLVAALSDAAGAQISETERRAYLKARVKTVLTKDGLIQVTVEDAVAERATKLANSFALAGQDVLSQSTATPEGQLLAFLSVRRIQVVNRLAELHQGIGGVGAVAMPSEAVRQQLEREGKLLAMLSDLSAKTDKETVVVEVPDSSEWSSGSVVERLVRQQYFYEALLKRIDRDITMLQPVLKDSFGEVRLAEVPVEKSSPKSARILALAGVIGLFGALFWVVFKTSWPTFKHRMQKKLARSAVSKN
ncbi:Wzz/FepE/Etk N-terminal domain-containing protein [Crenobacter luteus]|uniref:Wzz/FepE/Etk N-terminal domain-containing protein n=1 Tax=Crenobacter luteus TaxID=1452487 RepID=UPI001047D08A|nr:Wzz/FepE/Etk N-terminal domain-containing protein [Crenobacter luteus]